MPRGKWLVEASPAARLTRKNMQALISHHTERRKLKSPHEGADSGWDGRDSSDENLLIITDRRLLPEAMAIASKHEWVRHLAFADWGPEDPNWEANPPDRILPLDHNSAPYRDTMNAVGRVEELLRGYNAPDTSERPVLTASEKDRLYHEVKAGRTLLEGANVRLKAVANVLLNALKWLMEKMPDAAIGIAASAAYDLLKILLWS
ncbi:hypothetical protein ACFQX4_20670 [Roseomonas sp. GCM10028921]